jgi:hypothetical protein
LVKGLALIEPTSFLFFTKRYRGKQEIASYYYFKRVSSI